MNISTYVYPPWKIAKIRTVYRDLGVLLDFRVQVYRLHVAKLAANFPLHAYYSSSITALRVMYWVGPASGRHLGLKKRPKTARNRFWEGFLRIPDFHENRDFSGPPGGPL